MKALSKLFGKRPFRNRNAENFDLSEILDVFVDPLPETNNPFDFDNSIVKGRMPVHHLHRLHAHGDDAFEQVQDVFRI